MNLGYYTLSELCPTMIKQSSVRFKKKRKRGRFYHGHNHYDLAKEIRANTLGSSIKHDSNKAQALHLKKTATTTKVRDIFSLLTPGCSTISSLSVSMIIIVFILYIQIHSIQCQPLMTDFYPRRCEHDKDAKHESIKPMVVKGPKTVSPTLNSSSIPPSSSLSDNNGSFIADVESMSSNPLSENVSCPNVLKIHFSAFGDRFVIELVKNKRLISDRYFKISKDNINRHDRHPDATAKDSIDSDDSDFYQSHMFLDLHNFTSNEDHCHYHGMVNDNLNSISAISIVNQGLLSGFFQDGKEIYYLNANTTNSSTILTKTSDLCISKQNFTYADPLEFKELKYEIGHPRVKLRPRRAAVASGKSRRFSNTNPDNFIRHYPYMSNSSSLYVEMLVVHDHSQYLEYNGNPTNIAERTMQIVNIMNAFYSQLNIFIALVGVVLWTEKDEIKLTDDGDATLTNFLKYRYEKLLPKYKHDNAQLITSTSFNGSVVGKALKGPICTHEHSGGVNTDHSHSPAIVAVTLAHELGHNFGMEHDEEDKCKCPDEKCIMSSSSSTVHPKHWSSCSIEYLEESRKHGLLDCLLNEPVKEFGPICGNGFIEDGEDCDLGEPIPSYGTSKSRKSSVGPKCNRGQECGPANPMDTNPCCDRQTCKFVSNATCAQGPCCDLTKCSVYNGTETKVCRPRKTECDLEEVCDGRTEFCPKDVHYHDGIECGPTVSTNGGHQQYPIGSSGYNRSRSYCYGGKCASHESQCQLLWGPTASTSKDICYEQNVHGNTSGNCGFNRRDKIYESCELEDAICGMLHCVHDQPINGESKKTGKLAYGFESASILTVSFFLMRNQSKIYCHGAVIDAGPDTRDFGLVPNGAACGDDRMCLNQKCMPVNDVLFRDWCPSDCNGNGICDNLGTCHCHDGTIGTSCYQFFGPNFHLSLVLYIIMFFVPMIALIVFTISHHKDQIKIWWFLHNRKQALKERDAKRRNMAYDVNKNQISISDPIPLNQRNNTNRPFYEPPLDPWAETSCNGGGSSDGKPLGYRLEPLKSMPQPQQAHQPNSSPSNSFAICITPNQQTAGSNVGDANRLKPVRAAPPPPKPNSSHERRT